MPERYMTVPVSREVEKASVLKAVEARNYDQVGGLAGYAVP